MGKIKSKHQVYILGKVVLLPIYKELLQTSQKIIGIHILKRVKYEQAIYKEERMSKNFHILTWHYKVQD